MRGQAPKWHARHDVATVAFRGRRLSLPEDPTAHRPNFEVGIFLDQTLRALSGRPVHLYPSRKNGGRIAARRFVQECGPVNTLVSPPASKERDPRTRSVARGHIIGVFCWHSYLRVMIMAPIACYGRKTCSW